MTWECTDREAELASPMMVPLANTPEWDNGCEAIKARELQHRWSSRWALEGIYGLVGGMAQLSDFRHRGTCFL